MRISRVWIGLVVLAAVSFTGDRICRSVASGSRQEQLFRVASDAVGKLPDAIGPWRAVEAQPLTDSVVGMLQCRAYQNRIYVNDETGERVSLILLVGSAGPLVAHTPEICYGSSAFELVENTKRVVVREAGGRPDTLNRVLFRSNSVGGERQQVFYGWRPPSGHWQAPNNPRLELGGFPLLYKIQLATIDGVNAASSSEDAKPDESVNQRFLDELLPVLDSLLQNR